MLLLALLLSTTGLVTSGYVEFHNDKGVKVYRKNGSHGIDFAAEGDIAAPPEKVMKVLLDYAAHTKWVNHLAESQVISSGPFSEIVYQRLSLPVIDDRDYTLLVTWGEEGPARWMRFMTANDRGPKPKSGIVRINLHEGGWRLEPIDGGRATHAVYQFRLDLAGSMPGWMGRGRAGKDIPALFENIRRQLQYY
jgi:START domain